MLLKLRLPQNSNPIVLTINQLEAEGLPNRPCPEMSGWPILGFSLLTRAPSALLWNGLRASAR